MKERNSFWWRWCFLAALALALFARPSLAEEKANIQPQGVVEKHDLEKQRVRKLPPKEKTKEQRVKKPETSGNEPKGEKAIPITIPEPK